MASILSLLLSLLLADIALVSVRAANSEASVAKAFKKFQLLPDVVSKAPDTLLHVEFPSGVKAQLGKELTPRQVKDLPTLKWDAEDDKLYVIAMFDPDVPSRKNHTMREWNHWMVGNVPCADVAEGETLVEFVSSAPGNNTGLHRYTFLIYQQPEAIEFDEPRLNNTSVYHRANFSMTAFAEKYQLGDPVAGNFYQAKYDDYVPTVYKQLGV